MPSSAGGSRATARVAHILDVGNGPLEQLVF